MYLPKSKYKVKYTAGRELINPDGSNYTGAFIETYKGEVFSGSSLSSKSKRLTDLRVSNEFTNKPLRFKNDIISPTELDYKKGTFSRYFIQDRRNKKIIEVNVENYQRFLSKKFTKGIEIEWILSGPVENINKGPYIYFGAASKNKEKVLEAENTIKSLSKVVNNYGQFVV